MTDYNDPQNWFAEATKALNERGSIPHNLWDKMHDGLKQLLEAANVKIDKPVPRLYAGSMVRFRGKTFILCFVSRTEMLLMDPVNGSRWSDTRLNADPDQDNTVSLQDVFDTFGHTIEVIARQNDNFTLPTLFTMVTKSTAGDFVEYRREDLTG